VTTIRQRYAARLQRICAGDEGGFTLTELLVAIVITSLIVTVVASSLIVSARSSSDASGRMDESKDAQLAAAYFVADASSANTFADSGSIPSSCASSATLLADFQWSDAGTAKRVYYAAVPGSPALIRRCSYVNGASTPASNIAIVKNLKNTSSASVTCPQAFLCTSQPSLVELAVTETRGYTYALRATRRTASATSSGLDNFAAWVGDGGMTLKGDSTVSAGDGAIVVNGPSTCGGVKSVVNAPAGFFASVDGDCGPDIGIPPPDPLRLVPEPTTTGLATDPGTSTTTNCGTAKKTYRPGHYTSAVSFSSGCLATGVYFLDKGGSLDTVTSAPGGVLIFVAPDANGPTAKNDLSLNGTTTVLSPMTTGNDAGITIFMGRTNTGAVNTYSSLTVNGIIYAPAGELDLQSNNANLTSGAIDVKTLQIKGNGSGIIFT
jgi:prepilin-type N-terminal cleavage/methylation domain-containing protein